MVQDNTFRTAVEVGHINCDQLWWYADVAVAVLVDQHEGARSGGHLNIRAPSGEVIFDVRMRNPAADKRNKYGFLADEKTGRLWRHPEHTLSWESMNPELEQYQGAARATNRMLAGFSGFTAEEDEALVLWLFIKMGWMSSQEAFAATKISSNSRWYVLAQLFDQAEEVAD